MFTLVFLGALALCWVLWWRVEGLIMTGLSHARVVKERELNLRDREIAIAERKVAVEERVTAEQPDFAEMPPALISYATSWGDGWAQEDALKRMRELYAELGNWDAVFRAVQHERRSMLGQDTNREARVVM